MGQAVAANGILPAIAAEPAELGTGFCLNEAADSLLKATDFKGYTSWIEKGVFMMPLN